MFWISDEYLRLLIEEDLHILDLTSAALKLETKRGILTAAPKKSCVAAGVEEAARLLKLCGVEAVALAPNGAAVTAGDLLLKAEGPADRLHAAAKTAQNVMEHSSGIASRCAALVRLARQAAPQVEISVTRKHFPGTKRLSLAAALAGGASIHRLGLSDSILVFDQHRVFVGGVKGFAGLVAELKRRFPEKKIAAEIDDPAEAETLAAAGVDVVQCERFDAADLKRAVESVKAVNPRAIVLAAGGVTDANVKRLAATGVDALVTSWPFCGPPQDVKMTFAAARKPRPTPAFSRLN